LKRAVLLLAVVSCAPHSTTPRPVAPPPPPALHLAPLGDLVPAAGLAWIADLRPRVWFADPSLAPLLEGVLPDDLLGDVERASVGLDVRSMEEVVVAKYDKTTLLLAREVLDPVKVEIAFASRVAEVQGRAIDRRADDPRGVVVRDWGMLGKQRQAVVVFGREAAGLALGDDAPLRAAELFAEGRLKRAAPVWRAAPLDRIAALLGDAPLSAAAAGPFDAETARGLDGVLAVATGAGIAASPEGGTIRVRVAVTGGWGERSAEAREKLRASYVRVVQSGIGHLLGLAQPASEPRFAATDDSVTVDVRVDAAALLHGLADATTAPLREMMGRSLTP